MDKSGIFSLVEINDRESELFLSYLRSTSKSPAVDFINYLIGSDYLKFLDLLAGTTFKIPSRKSLYRDIEYIKIYTYVKERNFSFDAIRTAPKLYSKSLAFIKKAITKISKALDEELPYSYEELNNIRSVVDDGKRFIDEKDSWAFEDVGDDSLTNMKNKLR